MVTAVDTSVLLDVLLPDPTFGPRSADALRKVLGSSRAVCCDVVIAEVSAQFETTDAAWSALRTLGIAFDPVGERATTRAGAIWRAYRAAGGKGDRVIPDFLVGAHAIEQAGSLLTRDRGFYRRWFAGLSIVDPS